MSIDGPNVVEAKLLKQSGWNNHPFGMLLNALGQLKQGGCTFEDLLAHFLCSGVKAPAHELRQVAIECANRGADGHVVVVQNHQQIDFGDTRIVQGLKGHTGRHRTVSNDRHRTAILSLDASRLSHAQSGRDAGRRVRCAKGVKFAFIALGKTTQSTQLPERGHAVFATRQDLVRIGLVPHIPNQSVLWGVKDVVKGQRELNRSQIRAQMPACLGHTLEQKSPQLRGQRFELCATQSPHILRSIDRTQ